jgi:hypothetical protein
MPDNMEWVVALTPVRGADRVAHTAGLPAAPPHRVARVAELRRQVLGGYYASGAMMDLVARRILLHGDL